MSINKRVRQASDRVREILGQSAKEGWFPQLQLVTGFNRGARIIRRVGRSTDAEELKDALIEVRFAACLFGMGFDVEVEPKGASGPDLRVIREDLDLLI